jgi:hypothetical protein
MLARLLSFIRRFLSLIILDTYEKKFINYNLDKWKKSKLREKKHVILVDLFPWYPWVCFWSVIVNLFAVKLNARIEYFYFNLYCGGHSKFSYYIYKIKKIFRSFNVEEGISEYKFNYSVKEIQKYEKLFFKYQNSNKLLNFSIDGIKIGDLIYDTYLRIYYRPTITNKDPNLKKIFIRANKIFHEVSNYFKKNNVVCLIPSHCCYIAYGIISRIAAKNKIPVVKIFSKNRGNSAFQLLKVDFEFVSEDYCYYNYKNIFSKFSKYKKKEAILVGKAIAKKRISGHFDENLPYMKISSFNNKKIKLENFINNKKKIFVFPHCFFDNPHRYRSMLFNDFFLQVNFLLEESNKHDGYQWYYKPHPNELNSDLNIHRKILEKFPNVILLDKNISHKLVINSKPELVITNHGTLAHEYALFKVPVLNTGDNPHINYNFCYHAKNKKELIEAISNPSKIRKKISFDKNQIYEFLYMQYDYMPNLYNEKSLLKDKYFSLQNIKLNETSSCLNNFLNLKKNSKKKIEKYVTSFANNVF